MARYVGVDAHARSCTLSVMSASGRRIQSMVVETNGQALKDAIGLIPGPVHVCLEEGLHSEWLHELLKPLVEEVVVVVPPAKRGCKDDARDAWARADELRTGAIQTRVYKAEPFMSGLRAAVRAYNFTVNTVVRAKNRLKAVFLSRGICTDASVYDTERRATWLKKLPVAHRELADLLGRTLSHLEPLRDEAEQWLLREAKRHPIIRKLATVPGMGPIRCAQVVAVVMSPGRFRTRSQFWGYCGFGVVTRSSADWVRNRKTHKWERAQTTQTRGLSRKRQPMLKAVFKGAATTVINQVHDDPLYQRYQRMLQAGTKPNLAKLTLARTIAVIVLSMWKRQEVYDPKRLLTSDPK